MTIPNLKPTWLRVDEHLRELEAITTSLAAIEMTPAQSHEVYHRLVGLVDLFLGLDSPGVSEFPRGNIQDEERASGL